MTKELERLRYPWAEETMQMINKITPDVKGKAFDPDWFLLRQRLEQFEACAAQPTPEEPGLRERELRVIRAALAFSEAGTRIGFASLDMMQSSVIHEIYDSVAALASPVPSTDGVQRTPEPGLREANPFFFMSKKFVQCWWEIAKVTDRLNEPLRSGGIIAIEELAFRYSGIHFDFEEMKEEAISRLATQMDAALSEQKGSAETPETRGGVAAIETPAPEKSK